MLPAAAMDPTSPFDHAAGAALSAMPPAGITAVFDDIAVTVSVRASFSASDSTNGTAGDAWFTNRPRSGTDEIAGGWFTPVTLTLTVPVAAMPSECGAPMCARLQISDDD